MNLARFAADSIPAPQRIDGRIKTLVLLGAVIVSATLAHWQLALLMWICALAFFLLHHFSLAALCKRLVMPFGIAWLVFVNTIFTHCSHALFVLRWRGLSLVATHEGAQQGWLLFLRIMASVSCATLLAFSTPMSEILETLRLCKIPATIIDLADMMYRYIFILEETAHTMRAAQTCRLGNTGTWSHRIADTARISSSILIKALDRSTRIYQAMLARGYNDQTTALPFFFHPIPVRDRWLGGIAGLALLLLGTLNLCWR